jgi:hypothetical protein
MMFQLLNLHPALRTLLSDREARQVVLAVKALWAPVRRHRSDLRSGGPFRGMELFTR